MIDGLQDQDVALHVCLAGAGAEFLRELWMTPKTSSWLTGVAFPYSTEETSEFIGFRPDRFVSGPTAVQMAVASYLRASRDAFRSGRPGRKAVGLGMTAAVASVAAPPRRGGHRFHVAVMTDKGCRLNEVAVELEADSGTNARQWHDSIVSEATKVVLQDALGWSTWRWRWPGGIRDLADSELRELVFSHPVFDGNRRLDEYDTIGSVLYPGSFNPPHPGHLMVANVAEEFGDGVTYAICLDNVHKKPMSVQEALRRVAMLQVKDPGRRVMLTQGDPLFVDKARVHGPGRTFVVGADTLRAMLDPRWGVDPADVVAQLSAESARVVVVSRNYVDGDLGFFDVINERFGMVSGPLADSIDRVFTHRGGNISEVWSSTALRAMSGISPTVI